MFQESKIKISGIKLYAFSKAKRVKYFIMSCGKKKKDWLVVQEDDSIFKIYQ